MDVPRLSPQWEGFRIVQVSDLHVSAAVPFDYLAEQMAACRSLDPDLIVITGDLVTGGERKYLGDVTRLVGQLAARHGVLAVLGNHDYYNFYERRRTGCRLRSIAAPLTAALHDAGAIVLRNSSWTLERGLARLQFVGLEDWLSGRFDAAAAFAQVDPQVPCIALSHNPDTIVPLREHPCDWVLSGHTHGGQVRLPLIGPLYVPVRHREYDAGLFRVGRTRLYVNRGLGYVARVRFNCPPEITVFELTARG